MTYAVSDIHGCYDRYQKLLKKIDFGPDDTLYILGDNIDRGPDGFKLILDIAQRPNVMSLMGNHEAMAVEAIPCVLRTIQAGDQSKLSEKDVEAIDLWFSNGGEVSLVDFLCLDAEQAQTVWIYLLSMPLYKEVKVGEREFVLVHGGLSDFSQLRPLEDYAPNELLWCRPDPDKFYFPNKRVILGHTPTQLFYAEEDRDDRHPTFFKTDSFIDIDCGCVFPDGKLGCLCLDTMEEIYI